MTSFLILILIFLDIWLASASSQCYMLNGDLATADFHPCTSNLASGSNSACCNLGKNPPDICLGGGLCQRMDSTEGNFLIYAVGCTDESGKDAACPQYCPNLVEEYSLNPCYAASKPSWCCNDQTVTTCCGTSGGSFSFNLTTLGLSDSQQSSSTPTVSSPLSTSSNIAATGTCTAGSCPVGKGAVIGGSVGAFLAGTILAGLLGLYLAERRLRKHSQAVVPDTGATYVGPAELQTREARAAVPMRGNFGTGPPKYEMEAREVSEVL